MINVGVIESNKEGVVAIKRGSHLPTKVLKSFGPTEVARAAVRKHADHDQFLCGFDGYVLGYPDSKITQFIPGSNEEFTTERYTEKLDKPCSKIFLFLCNVNDVDDAADCRVVEVK